MASRLIEHLKRKSEDHEQLALLVSQWNFDRKLIPKALQNIGQLFPHYSRHDGSHSEQILVNIERLLGDDIQKLSATDTWLLLEAAYWHDIGMVVPADVIAHDLGTKEFKHFVAKIADTTGHEQQSFAKKFDPKDASSCFVGAGTPLEAVEMFRLLLAEYYRCKHPERAEATVIDPWGQVGISSPRNELLPKRLFFLLGQICYLHGRDFDHVLQKLEFRQVGMGEENCHPRFIACLLRLGDLLDLEDNRFCPVMGRMVGSFPLSSQAHFDKHHSIRHFRLDRDRIELKASCPNAAAYEETDRWFSWLKMEMQNQMASWQDIAPERTFGLLPTLGELRVELDGVEQWLEVGSKERPRFDIDAEKTVELLQGSGLYERPEQSLRELLQNAVDATLQRVWLEFSPSEGNTPLPRGTTELKWDNPYDPNMRELLKQYAIEVKLAPLTDKSGGEKRRWRLAIKDQGLGIGKDDLKWIRRIGSSSKNPARRDRIERMPKWMRPSGVFGIGMQSAFLITNEIQFKTKSFLTGETQEVIFYSPLGPQRGLITIKKNEMSPGSPCGSTLTLTHDFERIPKQFSWGIESRAYEILCAFDPIADQEMEWGPMKWAEEIEEFARYSPIPIQFRFKDSNFEFNQQPEEFHPFYDPETSIALNVKPIAERGRARLYFRGQIVNKYYNTPPFLWVDYHLWGDSAGCLLNINRNDIKYAGRKDLEDRQDAALISYIKTLKPDVMHIDDVACLSGLIRSRGWGADYSAFNDQWLNLRLIKEDGKTLKDLCNLESFHIRLQYQNPRKQKAGGDESKEEGADGAELLEFVVNPHEDILLKLLAQEWQKSGYHSQVTYRGDDCAKIVFQKKEFDPPAPYTNEALKAVLKLYTKTAHPDSRVLFPVYPSYQRLVPREGTKLYFTGILAESVYLRTKFMIMPFRFLLGIRTERQVTVDNYDDLCRWTVSNAEDATLTIEDAHNLYKEFIAWIDDEIMKDDEEWKKLRGK